MMKESCLICIHSRENQKLGSSPWVSCNKYNLSICTGMLESSLYVCDEFKCIKRENELDCSTFKKNWVNSEENQKIQERNAYKDNLIVSNSTNFRKVG